MAARLLLMAKRTNVRRAAASVVIAAVTVSTTAARATAPNADQCIDANEDAQGRRRAGRLLAAREKLRACVAASCPALIRADCTTRLEEIEAALPTVTLEAADADSVSLSDVRVTVDDALALDLPSQAAIELDPGEHRFVFMRTNGAARVQLSIVLREGVKRRLVAAVFRSPRPSVAENGPKGARGLVLFGRTVPTLTLGLVGVGAVGVTVGVVTGIAAGSQHTALTLECDANGGCPSTAQHDLDAFHSLRTLSPIA
jgi:hypothetical protein